MFVNVDFQCLWNNRSTAFLHFMECHFQHSLHQLQNYDPNEGKYYINMYTAFFASLATTSGKVSPSFRYGIPMIYFSWARHLWASVLHEPLVRLNVLSTTPFICQNSTKTKTDLWKCPSVPGTPVQEVLQSSGNIANVTENVWYYKFFRHAGVSAYLNVSKTFRAHQCSLL